MKVIFFIIFCIVFAVSPLFFITPQVEAQKPYDIHILEDCPWNISRIGADQVHQSGNTGQGVKVALLDTGIDYSHPELSAVYAGGWDFINNDSDPMDDNGHGTHCAGILAAAINGVGVIGVAPDIELYVLKVLDANGGGYWSDIAKAICWCIRHDIQITSNSYGGSAYDISIDTAFQKAWDAGILSIAAAGNSGGGSTYDTTLYPARLPSVVAVAATDTNNDRVFFSSTGPTTELSAPGLDIYSTLPGGGFAFGSGTSAACPHVAGVSALVKSAHPNWANEVIRGQMRGTADDLGVVGHDWEYGFGEVNAARAVGNIAELPSMPPITVVTRNINFLAEYFSVRVTYGDSIGFSGATVMVQFTEPTGKVTTKTGISNLAGYVNIIPKRNPQPGLWRAEIINVAGVNLIWDKEDSSTVAEIIVPPKNQRVKYPG